MGCCTRVGGWRCIILCTVVTFSEAIYSELYISRYLASRVYNYSRLAHSEIKAVKREIIKRYICIYNDGIAC